MFKPTPAELYAHEKSGEWLYDAQGYCPFARHKLEFLLRLAYQAGAASVTKTSALTPKQREAVVDVLKPRLSGDEYDLAREFGITIRDAKEMMRTLERVRTKLSTGEDQK